VAIITATLVLGTSAIPMQSYADKDNKDYKKTKDNKEDNKDYKKTKDHKSSINEKTKVDKKSANQHMDQDNFCYRGDNCEQANQGQQIIGEDNDAKGFNDQSDNLDLSTLDNITGTA
jgi:hypothetical protein